jgi:hypothetical protein
MESSSNVPRALDVSAYAAARLRELWHLQHLVGAQPRPDLIGTTSGTFPRSSRRIFQLLPWHVRRRTMSFSARRVPRRWRLRAEAELAQQPQASRSRVSQRQCQRYRRRTRRYYRQSSWLLRDRSEPHSQYGWLETHIWHAKRMHMFEPCWGGRLAWAPCDRGLASFWRCACRGQSTNAWRLASDVCALYDASWYGVIELPGELAMRILPSLVGAQAWARLCSETVWSGLKRLENTPIWDECGKLVAAQVEWLWEPNSAPMPAGGRRPTQGMESDKTEITRCNDQRRLWAFIHPLVKETVLALLMRSVLRCHLAMSSSSVTSDTPTENLSMAAQQQSTLEDPSLAISTASRDATRPVNVGSLDIPQALVDGLVRFEFYGKRSTETLYRVLRNAEASGRDWAAFSLLAMQATCADATTSHCVFHVECGDPRQFYPPRARAPARRRSQTQVDDNYRAFAAYVQPSGWHALNVTQPPKSVLSKKTLFDPEHRQAVSAAGRPSHRGIVSARVRRWRQRFAQYQTTLQQIQRDLSITRDRAATDTGSSHWEGPPTKRRRGTEPSRAADASVSSRARDAAQSDCGAQQDTQVTGDSPKVRIPLILMHRPACARRRWDSGWDVLLPRHWGMAFWNSFCYAGARGVGLRERRFLYHESGRCHFPEDFPECRDAYRCWAQREIHTASENWNRRPPSKRINFALNRIPEPFGVVDWLEAALFQEKPPSSMDESEARTLVVIRSNVELAEYRQRLIASCEESPSRFSIRYLVRVRLHPLGRASIRPNALICLANTLEASYQRKHTDIGERGQMSLPLEELPGNANDRQPTRPVIGRVTSSHYSWSDGCVRAYGFVLASALCGGLWEHPREPLTRRLDPEFLVRNVTCRIYRPVRLEAVFDWDP